MTYALTIEIGMRQYFKVYTGLWESGRLNRNTVEEVAQYIVSQRMLRLGN